MRRSEIWLYNADPTEQQGLSKAKRNPTLLIIISWWVVLGFTSFYPTYKKVDLSKLKIFR